MWNCVGLSPRSLPLLPYALCLIHQCSLKSMQNPVFGGVGICLMTMIIIDVAIGKVRRSFIAFGAMGAHQGHLNPLSGRSIYETCVEPMLLFGC